MKNLVYATAIALGSLSTISAHPPIFHDGIMELVIAQDFTEIAVKDVPTAVLDGLENDYMGATIQSAFVNEELQYKLEVTLEDGSAKTLYFDQEGNAIDM
ncbi:hypothetical protein OO009_04200 [Flavobacteriaceae bacterium KMM 6897]|nr:hypothetical protein [Flavobacteriaceae bacterium KMM 6897]MEB8345967.1 hypothetical protein [Flavobacteriaceae bacterium KMM 6898]